MEIEHFALSPVDHRNYEGLPLLDEPDVTHEACVQDAVHRLGVVAGILPDLPNTVPPRDLVLTHGLPPKALAEEDRGSRINTQTSS
jgi:hypothetical protein